MRLQAVVEFYQPYVSLNASPEWRFKQSVFQITFPLLLAVLASTPLLVACYWGYSLLSITICFVVLHTVRGLRNWLIAYPNSEGTLYISPSNSPSHLYLFMVTVLLAGFAFLATPYPYIN